MLAGQGLSKQEVEIVLGAIKGVKIAPLAYSQVNDMTDEIVELKEYKEKAQGAIAILGGATTSEKKERKPRSDKGTTRTDPPAPMKVEKEEEQTKKEAEPVAENGKGKKQPIPRKIKVSDADTPKGGKKESVEDIKSNIAGLGDGPKEDDEIPL